MLEYTLYFNIYNTIDFTHYTAFLALGCPRRQIVSPWPWPWG